jgi:hypothetical protein
VKKSLRGLALSALAKYFSPAGLKNRTFTTSSSSPNQLLNLAKRKSTIIIAPSLHVAWPYQLWPRTFHELDQRTEHSLPAPAHQTNRNKKMLLLHHPFT